jgi:transcriptional regulator GlxA family with amidase domain
MLLKMRQLAVMLFTAAVMISAFAQQSDTSAQKSGEQMSHQMAHQMNGMTHGKESKRLRVAVLLYEGVEEIDYAGPIEVFGASGLDVFTVAQTKAPVASVYGLQLLPDHDFSDAPAADVLLVPGGGIKLAWKNPALLAWIRQRSGDVKIVMSVCSGAFILGKAGLLDGIAATTTSSMRDQLSKNFPGVEVRSARYVDSGRVITTAGISAGIDGALHLVARELGEQTAQAAARYMEYEWKESPLNK